MDWLQRCYRSQMRLFKDSDRLDWVRWYPAAPGARWFSTPNAYGSSQDDDRWFPFVGPGEVWSSCPEWVSCNTSPCPGQDVIGDLSWFVDGAPLEILDGPIPPPPDCGDPMARWAELVDRDILEARSGWWQLRCDPLTGRLVRGPLSWLHRIEEDPAWEVQGKLAIPVPGTIVEVSDGCDGRPWHFKHDDLVTFVQLLETTPSVDLGGGVLVYNATTRVQQLAGTVGDQVVTGTFAGGEACYVLDLAATPPGVTTRPFHGRLAGRFGGRNVYTVDQVQAGGSSPADCAACDFIYVNSSITDYDVADYEDGSRIYIVNSATGAVGRWKALNVDGVRGWIDECTCTESWWCTPAGCVAAVGRPDDAIDGPFPNLDCCISAECATPCCAGDLPPDLPSSITGQFLSVCTGIDGAEIAGGSGDGTTFTASGVNPCGSGMATFNCTVSCVELVPGYNTWRMVYSWEDGENPQCNGSGVSYAIRDGSRGFFCNPLDMTFPVTLPPLCCAGCPPDTAETFIRFFPGT